MNYLFTDKARKGPCPSYGSICVFYKSVIGPNMIKHVMYT